MRTTMIKATMEVIMRMMVKSMKMIPNGFYPIRVSKTSFMTTNTPMIMVAMRKDLRYLIAGRFFPSPENMLHGKNGLKHERVVDLKIMKRKK